MSATTTNVMNLVAGMATKKSGKKDSKPEVNDPALAEAVDTYIARKADFETAEALMKSAADQIVSAVRPKRLECCVAVGKVVASISINGKLTFTQQDRYSAVPEERSEALQAAFGESFDRYFASTLGISLKKDSANNEAVLTKLIETLGGDFFQAHFDVKRDLLVKDAFHNDYSCRPEVQAVAQPFIDEQSIRPYSPSLKVS